MEDTNGTPTQSPNIERPVKEVIAELEAAKAANQALQHEHQTLVDRFTLISSRTTEDYLRLAITECMDFSDFMTEQDVEDLVHNSVPSDYDILSVMIDNFDPSDYDLMVSSEVEKFVEVEVSHQLDAVSETVGMMNGLRDRMEAIENTFSHLHTLLREWAA